MSSDAFWYDEIERVFGVRLDADSMFRLKRLADRDFSTPVEALREIIEGEYVDLIVTQSIARGLRRT